MVIKNLVMKTSFLLFFVLISGFAVTSNAQLSLSDLRSVMNEALVAGKNEEVIRIADSLEAAGRTEISAPFYRAKANEALMRYNKAYDDFKKWYETDTTNLAAAIAVARMANLAGRTDEAAMLYEKLLATDSLSFSLNYQLARIYQNRNDHFKALNVFQRIYPADSLNVSLLVNMGDSYNELQIYPGAIGAYSTAFYQNPYNQNVAIKAVNAIIAFKDMLADSIAGAIAIVDTALVYVPQSLPLKQTKGILCFMNGDNKSASMLLENVIAGGDSSKVNFRYLALSHYKLRNFVKAMTAYKCAYELYKNPDGSSQDGSVVLKYAELLGRFGQQSQSGRILNEYEEQLKPAVTVMAQIYYLKGMNYSLAGNREQAARHFWKSYNYHPLKNALLNYTNQFYNILDTEVYEKSARAFLDEAIYANILLLEKVEDNNPGNPDSMHAASRKIIYNEIQRLFMQGETELSITDADQRKHVYTVDKLRSLIRENTY